MTSSSGTRSSSTMVSTNATSCEKEAQQLYQDQSVEEQDNEQAFIINRNLMPNSSLRRPRAETMPTQSTSFPYNTEHNVLMIDPSRPSHHHHHHHQWMGESVQSPTTPTTDQLLKGDDNNTIASTFASLGLDEHPSSATLASPSLSSISFLHTSRSYSSLQTLSEEHQHDWYAQKSSDSIPYFRGEDLRSSVANLRLSHQHNRPRAMSAVDQQQQEENNSPLLGHRSIWHPDISKNRPFLRSSNSSADLLEMIARQRKATATATNSPNGSHIVSEEDASWAVEPFTAGGSVSSSYEQLSNSSINLTEVMESSFTADIPANQIPTRSLWLGQLDISSQTTNELQMIFSKFGVIESIRVLPDRECAFVNFSSVEEALRARDALASKMLYSLSTVKVGFGKPEAVPSSPTAMPMSATATATESTTQGPTRALWVGNIPINTTQAALGNIFASFGMIESIRVLTHKNCGFINFFNQEDAIKAKKALQNREIMGPGTGSVRIGFAKVPAVKSQNAAGGLVGIPDIAGFQYPSSIVQQQQTMMLSATPSGTPTEDMHQQMAMRRMMDFMGNRPGSVFPAIVTERKCIMQELGEDDSDGPIFDALRLPQKYYNIPAAPELGQSRRVDISRLRDIRKRLDNGSISTQELEMFAIECVEELVELCSDYIGNTVIQRLFERCSEQTKTFMLNTVAPYIASIGVHKNGTWAAQKIIDTCSLSDLQTALICENLKPYVPALLLDQFGNYVVQCCLSLGPTRNQFIFDAIVDACWEIVQGRFGARAVRATLESPHVTKRQQKYVAASLVQHALLLATNANGALLLIWLLDTSGIPGRYRVLAPRLLPHLAKLCTHKLASLTVLKLINQRQEPEARTLILDALFFSTTNTNEVPSLISEVLHDQVHGVSLVQKIFSSSYIELRDKQRIAERVKQLLYKLRLHHVQGYKRLMEEINMVMVDSAPGASLGVGLPSQFSISPGLAAALQAKYIEENNHNTNEEQHPSASMMANFYAVAAAVASSSMNPEDSSQQ